MGSTTAQGDQVTGGQLTNSEKKCWLHLQNILILVSLQVHHDGDRHLVGELGGHAPDLGWEGHGSEKNR